MCHSKSLKEELSRFFSVFWRICKFFEEHHMRDVPLIREPNVFFEYLVPNFFHFLAFGFQNSLTKAFFQKTYKSVTIPCESGLIKGSFSGTEEVFQQKSGGFRVCKVNVSCWPQSTLTGTCLNMKLKLSIVSRMLENVLRLHCQPLQFWSSSFLCQGLFWTWKRKMEVGISRL